jgi:beta-xylosidase
MSSSSTSDGDRRRFEGASYTNPVYAGYFADPFVWRQGGSYYAVGTGPAEAAGQLDASNRAGRDGDHDRSLVFPLLQSEDFVGWRPAGRALVRPDPALGDTFWAPEIAFAGGVFYLYYSVGHGDRDHHLRVAASAHPLGPYRDVGAPLTDPGRCPFAIDPHPFRDDDGRWYLFYAADFLDEDAGTGGAPVRAGTALVVAALETMTRLAAGGAATTVLRARHDWQRFQIDRAIYGRRLDWHTLEGPSVRKHAGRYYCFYSGGRWETDRYGVDYAVAERVLGPYSDAGAERGPRVLRSAAGALGPGHNSLVEGPGGATYLAYHAWDRGMTARRMCLDRLDWTGHGPRSPGPTTRAQPIG